MKLQPLNLDDLREKISDLTILIATAREEGDEEEHKKVVNNILELFRQCLKSACEFWLKYKDNPVLLCREKPEYKKEFEPFATAFKSSSFSSQKLKWILNKYNDWLFHLVFKSILEDDKK